MTIGTRQRVNIGVTEDMTKTTEITLIKELRYDRSVDTNSSSTVYISRENLLVESGVEKTKEGRKGVRGYYCDEAQMNYLGHYCSFRSQRNAPVDYPPQGRLIKK